MVRIAEGEHPKDIRESDYFTPQGEFRVDKAGSPTLLNCLMYKMSYYRFGEMQMWPGQKLGQHERINAAAIRSQTAEAPCGAQRHFRRKEMERVRHRRRQRIGGSKPIEGRKKIGNKDIKFKHLEEAFTSEHWLVRIYKVKNLDNREPLDHKLRSVVPKQKYTSKKSCHM
ncbi:hypothetical protein INR49_027467 [Caranx melampygus]|nr:hypothetical protein INR49_027467 [Caranx melampygus]